MVPEPYVGNAQIGISGYRQTDLFTLDRGDARPIPIVISPRLIAPLLIASLVLAFGDAFCDWAAEDFNSEKKGEPRLPLYR